MDNDISRLSSDSNIEHSVWVKNWGGFPDINSLPPGVNTINIFEGKIDQVNGKWVINGMVWTSDQLKSYIDACHQKGISVKISLGGAGGQGVYNNTWDQLTSSNVAQMGEDLAEFCKQTGVDGIDFDYEEQKSDEQRELVGQLIGYFKKTAPDLHASVCTNAGNDGTSKYPWESDLKQILDTATETYGGKCPVDRLYVMSYDYTIGKTSASTLKADEEFMKQWISFGSKYGIDPNHISIGVDPTETNVGLNENDRKAYVEFAKSQGLSTAVWDQMNYQEGKYTQQITDWYNQSK